MTQSTSDIVIPEDCDCNTPDHLIIWLDTYIGDPEKYHQLKKAFSSNVDPRNQAWTMLTDRDYDNLLRLGDAKPVNFGGIPCLLLAYTDPDACYAAFERYKDKRILFITSGSLGQHIVPLIIENYQHVFTDPVTNDPCSSIYIFCLDIPLHFTWAGEFYEYVQMFDHEADLLARMTRDMASYYSTQCEREYGNQYLEESLKFYCWSKNLFLQCQKMQQQCQEHIDKLEKKIQEIEARLQASQSQNGEDEKGSEPCG